MKPFNVTTITLPDYPHSRALEEAAAYVQSCLVRAGYAAELRENRIETHEHNIVFCGHLLGIEALDAFPKDTIIFNSEQLQNRDGWYFAGAYGRYLERFYIWDYSIKNLARIGHGRGFFIPFLFCPDLVRAGIPRVRGDNLCFYGGMTERRKKLMAKINAAGVPVQGMFNKYGAERDAKIFRSWAVLNLRQHDEVTTFEPVRCFYPLTNGVPIVSESSASDPTFDYYKDWLFAFDTPDLARETGALYRDRDSFFRAAEEKLALFRATSGPAAIKEAVDVYGESLR